MTDTVTYETLVQVLQPIVLRNDRELQEGEDGEVYEIDVPVFANPGDIIDVSGWHDIGAYVNRGQIRILGPEEHRSYVERREAEAEAAKQAKAAARQAKQTEPKE